MGSTGRIAAAIRATVAGLQSIRGPRRVRRLAARLWFERGALEDTYGAADLSRFGLGHPDRVEYRPSGWRHLSRALEGRVIDRSDVFLDYGCGKGRIVYQAASLPFGRVIGLEISSELLDVARRNVVRNRHRLVCQHIDLVCGDALTYEVPDDVTYVYMYNPFLGDVFRAALASLMRSLDRQPRHLTLIYVHPMMAEDVERSGRFQLVRDTGDRAGERISVYEARPNLGAA
jgi:SAM-dependent methyltransferase